MVKNRNNKVSTNK